MTGNISSGLAKTYFAATRSGFWQFCIDLYPILIAAFLPWSTTAVVVFLSIWLIVVAPSLLSSDFVRSLRHPASLLPLVFFGLAVAGMSWANDSWSVRFQGLGPLAKLLVIPLLLFHFRRSTRANWVFLAFLLSCALLLAYSWLIYAFPLWRFTGAHGFDTIGVPVKSAIDQNQEFAVCAFGLAALTVQAFLQSRFVLAAALGLLAIAFVSNILFVALARTSLAYIPVLAIMLAFRYFDRRLKFFSLALLPAAAALLWFGSPYLRERVEHVAIEYKEYQETNRPTSTGQRLTYWKDSFSWIREAPILGHGTGSVNELFKRTATGKQGAWADKIANPHNQTLYAAIQWGALGCICLYAMWFVHWRLFRADDFAAWIGSIVVVQNVISSLLNSHLIDFNEGWLYVLGVGVAGGYLQRRVATA
jgi:O-antigen ligase